MTDQLLKRYLLGELPVDEQRRLEEMFFSEAEAFERLTAIEDDLIDDYVCGDLSRRQRERFETYFLISPERRERLALAEALVATVSEQPASVAEKQSSAPWWESILDFLKLQNPTIRLAVVAASLVFLVYGTKETLENNNLRRQIYQLQKAQESAKQASEQEMSQALARNEQLQKELQRSAQREQELTSLLEPPPQVLKAATRTRGGILQEQPMRDLQVTKDMYLVKLRLEFDKATTFKTYRAVLQPYSGGDEIWSQGHLQPQATHKAKVVTLTLPASVFAQAEEAVQEYKLTLWGADTEEEPQVVEVYAFRVVKK